MDLRPSLRTEAVVSSAAARWRSATKTLAPSSANRIAVARPIPLAPPVIRAFLFSSLRAIETPVIVMRKIAGFRTVASYHALMGCFQRASMARGRPHPSRVTRDDLSRGNRCERCADPSKKFYAQDRASNKMNGYGTGTSGYRISGADPSVRRGYGTQAALSCLGRRSEQTHFRVAAWRRRACALVGLCRAAADALWARASARFSRAWAEPMGAAADLRTACLSRRCARPGRE